MRSPPLTIALGLVATSFLTAFFLFPLAVILQRSFSGWEGLAAIITNPYYGERLLFTGGQALASTLLTVILALPTAVLFARYTFPGKRLLRSAFTVPFVMPTVVAAMGFLALVGPNGLLDITLRGKVVLILLAHVFYNYAVVVRIVGSHLERAAPRLLEAAATLGAGGWRSWWRVTLPLSLPAVLAAAALVFIFCFTSFGIILILAPNHPTLEVEIYRLTARLLRLDAAAVLAMTQLIAIGLVTWCYTALQRRLAVPLARGAPQLPRPRGLARLILQLNLLAAFILILSPLLAIVVETFWRSGSALPDLAAFRALAHSPRSIGFANPWNAIGNSLRFALSSMFLSLLLGLAFAYAVVRAGWHWLDNLSLMPLATSAVTLGFGYLLAFPKLTISPWGVTLAHTLIGFPFVTRSLLPSLRGLPASLPDAARVLGSSPLAVLRRVELPLLAPALVTAASFAFAVSMGEFGATLVITRPEYATIPIAIFDRLGRPGEANYSAALALSVILMVITAAAMMLFERFGEGEW